MGCSRTLPRSKQLNLSYERAFGAYAANQEIDVATQHSICEANQDTAKHSKTYVQPELELEVIQTKMAQKPILRSVVYARASRVSRNVERAEVWVDARCADGAN